MKEGASATGGEDKGHEFGRTRETPTSKAGPSAAAGGLGIGRMAGRRGGGTVLECLATGNYPFYEELDCDPANKLSQSLAPSPV